MPRNNTLLMVTLTDLTSDFCRDF